ncbi:MAG: GTP cyclohydrolase I FolE [Candidatus Bipolaricaulota bacterium]
MNRDKIREGARLILEGIGEDLERPGLIDTPDRIARMYEEFFADIDSDPADAVEAFFQEDYEEMVILRDIPFHSLCEHHLLPFIGTASIVYMPKDGRVVGASKLARVLEIASNRPQVQERLTSLIADVLMEKAGPHGVLVKMSAEHLCMTIRGIKKPGTTMVTSAIRGVFETDKASRDEALSLIDSG